MPRIELPVLDADSFEARLEELLPKNAAGKPITAWKTFSQGVKSMRRLLQDGHNAQDVQLTDLKSDVDAHTERLNKQADRLAVLEAQPAQTPFGG